MDTSYNYKFSNVNFQAISIAKTKNIFRNQVNNIDLYELTPKDNRCLDDLKNSIDFSSILNKSMSEYEINRWKKVFNYAIDSAKDSANKAYIAISNSRPCGLLSFTVDKSEIFLDAICAIPQKNAKRVPFTGSTLFYQLFKIAQDLKLKDIILYAVANGPLNVVEKYKSKGFKDIGMNGEYIKMICNKYKFKEQLDKLSLNINYESVQSRENIPFVDLIV